MKRPLTIVTTIALIILLPLYTILLFSGLAQQQVQSNDLDNSAKNLLSIYSLNEESIINDIHQNLILLSKNPYIINGGQQECNDSLAKILNLKSYYANILFIKPNGSIYCGGIMTNADKINEKGEAFFENAISTNDFSIGNYQTGRIIGKPIIGFGYPVYKSDSSLAGVVAISLNLSWLQDYYQSFSLPMGSSVLVIDNKGTIINQVGDTSFTIAPLSIQNILNEGSKTPSSIKKLTLTEANNTTRNYFIKTLNIKADNPLTLVVSIDKNKAQEPVDNVLKISMLYLIGTSFISILIAAGLYPHICKSTK